MARIRTIKPDFWTDEKVVELSPFARLLFIGLWNFADDDGRMVYSPKKIKMQIFPADTLEISGLFGEIRGESLIEIYTVDSIEYLQINNFSKHQKIDKRTASKLPEFKCDSLNPTESPRIPTTEGKGMEGEVEGNGNYLTTNNSTPFQISLDWNPSEAFKTLAHMAGLNLEKQNLDERRAEFISYWLTQDLERNQSEWDKAFLDSLMRFKNMPPKSASSNQAKGKFDPIAYVNKGKDPANATIDIN